MNKRAAAVKKDLEKLKSEKNEKLNKYNQEIKITKVQINRLSAELETIEEPEKFKEVNKKLNDAKDYLFFLEKQKNKTSVSLSKEDFDKYKKDLFESYKEVVNEYSGSIESLIEQLVSMLESYTAEIEEQRKIGNALNNMCSGQTQIILSPDKIITHMKCTNEYTKYFVEYFFYTRSNLIAFKTKTKGG